MTVGPHVVALGGGHGLATTLRAVRRYAGRVTAVVSVADDGGSSGRLRQIAGIPAPGDLRRCLVAMAADGLAVGARRSSTASRPATSKGHALGNLIIAGLANVTGDFGPALDLAAGLLGAAGRVLPATSVPVVLKADVAGTEVVGQVNVSESPGPISSVSIVPPDAPVPAEVLAAVAGRRPGGDRSGLAVHQRAGRVRRSRASGPPWRPRRAGGSTSATSGPSPPRRPASPTDDHLRAVLRPRRAGRRHGRPPPAPRRHGSSACRSRRPGRPTGAATIPNRLAAVLRLLT